MEFEDSATFVSALRNEIGDDLRSVAEYDRDGYEFLYRREDVEELYTEESVDEMHEALIIEGLGREYLESLFSAGPMECALYGFESAYVVHVIGGEYDGLVVSVDADAEIPIGPFVGTCRSGAEALLGSTASNP